MKAKRTLLLGWDAADWKVIDQLIERSLMPTLKKMVENGVRGNLSTIEPPLSPMLWTSIATGKNADKHGIHGFIEPDFERGIVQPISCLSRKSKAIWNIFTQQELKSNVFAWWPSHPAEPINGICVSNRYQRAEQSSDRSWPMLKGSVYPESLVAHFKQCRIHPEELTEAHILPFIPNASKIDQEKEKRIGGLSKILADAATIHAASTWALENTEWDFSAIYHDAIDHSCHGFMKFRAPRLQGVPEDMFENYRHVVDGMYQFHDMMLDRIFELIGSDTNVILISDHGFHSDHLRPLSIPTEPAGPAVEHRKHGIICCYGPDFKSGEEIYGASILDITPTLLTLYGLPIGEDMDGTPLVQAFKDQPAISKISSWENVEGNFGEHPKGTKLTENESKEAIQQLVDLGYVDDLGDDSAAALAKSEVELKYNLSKVYASTSRPKEALALLEDINKSHPQYRFQRIIADCLNRLGRFDDCKEILSSMRKEDTENNKEHSLMLLEAEIFLAQDEGQQALRILLELNEKVPNSLVVLKKLAVVYISIQDWKQTELVHRACLEVDPNDATAFRGLALSLLRQKKFEESVDAALRATELVYQYPSAHYILGEALFELKEFELAAKSLEIASMMRPASTHPRLLLDKIYKKHKLDRKTLFDDLDVNEVTTTSLDRKMKPSLKKAQQITQRKKEPKGDIIVVSGLPRSGTSMMMQMLDAGGVSIYTDNKRQPDENNPKGFFEHEKVKGIAKQNNWVKEANGMAVKVVIPLMRHLPPTFRYKFIVMERAVEDVITSQINMLARNGKPKKEEYPVQLETALKKTLVNSLHWIKEQPNIELLVIHHKDAIENPQETAKIVTEFLGKPMNLDAMSAVVSPSLHRTNTNKK